MIQSRLPDELIIIDNNSTDGTAKFIKRLQKTSRLKIHYVLDKAVGYPFIYNRGLITAKHSLVAFLDDDCLASIDWLGKLEKAFCKRKKHLVAAVGNSQTQKKNFFSYLTHFKDFLWKKMATDDNNLISNLEILDTKNILYSKQWLIEKGIGFDQKLVNDGFLGACQDSDLGMQIAQAGGQAIYADQAVVFHRDPDDLIAYLKKIINSSRAHAAYEKKWHHTYKKSKLVNIPQTVGSSLIILKNYLIDYNLSILWWPFFALGLASSFLLVKVIKFYEKLR